MAKDASTRHSVKITFEDGRVAWVIVDENNEVSVRGLRNIVGVEYLTSVRS